MNRSTTKSRIIARRKKRRKERIRRAVTAVFGTFAVILLICLGAAGIRSGLKMSREVKYPVQYSEYIVKYANENELDPYLVIAVIKQESNFVADARSPYAGGLMQLTEETAADYAKKMKLTNYNYMDPETNIRIGCFVLRSLLDKYTVVDTALAAYNAGAGNVDSWLKNPDYSSDGATLTYIPFDETRSYVRKIAEYRLQYSENVVLNDKI